MAVVAFDTLKLARRLETAGFSREQATGTAEALAETFAGELATKSDLAEQSAELQRRIAELRAELKADIAELRAELKTTGERLEAANAKQAGELRSEIAVLRSDTAKWIISAVFINILAMIGLVAAVCQLAHK